MAEARASQQQGLLGRNAVVQKEPSSLATGVSLNEICDEEDLGPPATATTTELGYLNQVSEIVVKQGLSVTEMTRGTEEPNMYSIEEKGTGEKLYKVYEDTNMCMVQACGANRAFKLRIMDNFDRELIWVERPYVSCSWCFGMTDFCDIVNVWVRNYKSKQFEWRRFGQVKQFWCPIMPYMSIRNAVGEAVFSVRGPLIRVGCCRPVVFPIKKGSETVGHITKEWGGFCRETLSGIDAFSMKFPDGIDEKMKVTLIGALLLIDFKFYERTCRCFIGY